VPGTRNLLLTGLLLAVASFGLLAEDKLPELSADEPIVFDQDQQKMIARGNATLEQNGLFVRADEISYSQKEHELEAIGDVQATRKKTRFLANEATLNTETQIVDTKEFRLGRYPVYAEGDSLTGGKKEVTMRNSSVYFGEPDPFAIHVDADEITLQKDKKESTRPDTMLCERAKFRLGKISFFSLPHYKQNLYQSPVRFKAKAGHTDFLGSYLQTTSFIRLNEQLKVGALLDGYSKRGPLFGPALEYKNTLSPMSELHGNLKSGYIYDRGKRKPDINGNKISRDRGFIEWRNQQWLDNGLTMTSSISYWSDSDVERDFRPSLFRKNQQPDSFAELIYPGDNYYISLFLRVRANDFQVVQERLPEVRFDYLTSPIGESNLYQRGFASIARLEQPRVKGNPKLSSTRADLFYNLSYPLDATDWLTIVPVAGTRVNEYFDSSTSGSNYRVLRGQFGFDLQGHAYGQWDYQNKRWKIDGLRHLVRPIVQYRYIPRASYGSGGPAPIDVDGFNTNLRPLDLGDKRNIDETTTINTMRLGVENILQTRTQEYGGRDLVGLNVYQDIRFKRYSGQDRFSSFFTELMLSPWNWLQLSTFSRVDFNKGELQELRTRTRLLDGNVWQVDFLSDNLIRRTDQYFLKVKYRLNAKSQFRAQWRYNARLKQLTEQSYGYRTRIGNAWAVEYVVGYRIRTTRENDFRFQVKFELLVR